MEKTPTTMASEQSTEGLAARVAAKFQMWTI